MSVFETLSVINVNDKKSKKNNLDYLSWAFAWSEVKKVYPEANSKVYENEQGLNYHTDGRTAWVKKAIQRGLVKAIARHGLGLYIYANEDLPDLTEEQKLLEAEKQRLREIQPALNRAEELGYPNMELLRTKTKKEIFDIMTIWKATEGK